MGHEERTDWNTLLAMLVLAFACSGIGVWFGITTGLAVCAEVGELKTAALNYPVKCEWNMEKKS